MRLLALEPYFAGSHRAFLDGWREHSAHAWTMLTLPGHKWKWRMRHASFTLAEEINRRYEQGERWDILFASDMVNLAELLGLARKALTDCPVIAYFHENQLTYPAVNPQERDFHFTMTNLATAAAADQVWFNSEYHRREFLAELPRFLRRMPDNPPLAWVEQVARRSSVYPQGIMPPRMRPPRAPGVIRILWAARWEYDKNPDDFFAAIRRLRDRGIEFRISVIGQKYESVPPVFATARDEFVDRIDRWGYQERCADHEQSLLQADVIVSTAVHEFFGVSVVEAAAAGAFPVLPNRLAYPEIFPPSLYPDFFYDGSVNDLAVKLEALAHRLGQAGSVWPSTQLPAASALRRFFWPELAPELDQAVSALCRDDCH